MGKKKSLTDWISGDDKTGPRKTNDHLCSEHESVIREHRRYKGLVDQLEREYEESKSVDFIRRYGLLKSMIKRTIVQLRLDDKTDPGTSGMPSAAQMFGLKSMCRDLALTQREMHVKKMGEKYADLSDEALSLENNNLVQEIKEFNQKISILKGIIFDMDNQYEDSKRYIAIQRYRLMKGMVKNATHNSKVA